MNNQPIQVSEIEMKRLEALAAMRSTGQKSAEPSGEKSSEDRWNEWIAKDKNRDIPAEVWDTTKKAAKVYIAVQVAWAMIVLPLALIVGIFIFSTVLALVRENEAVFQQHPIAPSVAPVVVPVTPSIPAPAVQTVAYQSPVPKHWVPKVGETVIMTWAGQAALNRADKALKRAERALDLASAAWDRASEALDNATDRWQAYQTNDLWYSYLRAKRRWETANRRYSDACGRWGRAEQAWQDAMPQFSPMPTAPPAQTAPSEHSL